MDRNLITVALTILTLGGIATFDIIPGAGLTAGAVLLAAGAMIFIGQFMEAGLRFSRTLP
jgi:hypothetical protein